MPNYAYPRVKFNREELRKEVNKQSSYFHDLRGSADDSVLLGSFYLEILQCFGIPRSEELLKVCPDSTVFATHHATTTTASNELFIG